MSGARCELCGVWAASPRSHARTKYHVANVFVARMKADGMRPFTSVSMMVMRSLGIGGSCVEGPTRVDEVSHRRWTILKGWWGPASYWTMSRIAVNTNQDRHEIMRLFYSATLERQQAALALCAMRMPDRGSFPDASWKTSYQELATDVVRILRGAP